MKNGKYYEFLVLVGERDKDKSFNDDDDGSGHMYFLVPRSKVVSMVTGGDNIDRGKVIHFNSNFRGVRPTTSAVELPNYLVSWPDVESVASVRAERPTKQ
jgi:hypothetical protein